VVGYGLPAEDSARLSWHGEAIAVSRKPLFRLHRYEARTYRTNALPL
jgi:hypothetical protein